MKKKISILVTYFRISEYAIVKFMEKNKFSNGRMNPKLKINHSEGKDKPDMAIVAKHERALGIANDGFYSPSNL